MSIIKNYKFDELLAFDWNRTKSFYYIVKLTSFTQAAQFLKTDQSELFCQIQSLENELNVLLFDQKTETINLTRKGQEFFDLVESYFTGLQSYKCTHRVKTHDNKKRHIRISSTPQVVAYILNKYLLEFNIMYPDIVFEIIADNFIVDLILNDIDMFIGPYNHYTKGITQEPLMEARKKLFASSQYLSECGEPQNVEDLKDHRIIAPSSDCQYPYSDVFWILRLGLLPGEFHKPVYTSNSVECCIQAAQAGVGIVASYDDMDIMKSSGLEHILPFVVSDPVKSYILFPDHLKDDEIFTNLKDFLKSKFQ